MDRSLIPARCCQQPLPNEWVEKALTTVQMQKYLSFQKKLTSVSIANLYPAFAKMVNERAPDALPAERMRLQQIFQRILDSTRMCGEANTSGFQEPEIVCVCVCGWVCCSWYF